MFNYNNITNFSDYFTNYEDHQFDNLDYLKILDNFDKNINNINYINKNNIKYIDFLLENILLKKSLLFNEYTNMGTTQKNKYIKKVNNICKYLLNNNLNDLNIYSLSLILNSIFCEDILKYLCKNFTLDNKVLLSLFDQTIISRINPNKNFNYFRNTLYTLYEIFDNFNIDDLNFKLKKCDILEKNLILLFSKSYFSTSDKHFEKLNNLLLLYYKLTNSIPDDNNLSLLFTFNYNIKLYDELLKLGVIFSENNLTSVISSFCISNNKNVHDNIIYLLNNNVCCNNDHLINYVNNIPNDIRFNEDVFEKIILCGSTFTPDILISLSKKNIILKNIQKYNLNLSLSEKENLALIFTERDKFFPYPYSKYNLIKPNIKCLQYLCLKRSKYDVNYIKKYIKTYEINPDITCLENACLIKQNVSIINLLVKKYHLKPNEKCLKNIAYTINNKSLITIIDLYFKNIENKLLKKN